MASPRFLTKSRFKLAVECPTKLFYTGKKSEYKDIMEGNDFMAMLAEGGYQVGELAQLKYPDGILIPEKDSEKAIAITKELLKREQVILFEPAISVGNFLVRVDILIKNGNHFKLIEVKAKSYDSSNPDIEGKRVPINASFLPYIQDAAFQTWVLRQSITSAEVTAFLMMPDKSKVASIDGINQFFKYNKTEKRVEQHIPSNIDIKSIAEDLLEEVCVDKYVNQVLNNEISYPGGSAFISDIAAKWADAYERNEKIPPSIGAQCGSCQFMAPLGDKFKSGFHECWKQANNWKDEDFAEGTVLDLWNSKNKARYIKESKLKLPSLRGEFSETEDEADKDGLSQSQRQKLQVVGLPDEFESLGFYLDKSLVAHSMSQWTYPYHMIDFETSTVALPFYKDMRPYEAVAFQFSHHIMEDDGKVTHAGEFLCVEPGEFPNYKFARELKKQLDQDNGSVFMWSPHENTILNTILKQLNNDVNPPSDAKEIKEFLLSLIKGGNREMIDLCKLASKAYFHPCTKGSNSIKKVLPAILNTSHRLKETYSSKIYGAPDGMESLNFKESGGFAWLTEESFNDPYLRLKAYANDLIPEGFEDSEEAKASLIAEGGAAATAYARLQFEDLDNESRERIKSALLRYCELDTLAMIMVLQGWQEMLEN